MHNLLASVESERERDDARLLFGLGIRHVGEVTARDLMKNFETLSALREAAEQARAGGEDALSEPLRIDLTKHLFARFVNLHLHLNEPFFGVKSAARIDNGFIAEAFDEARTKLILTIDAERIASEALKLMHDKKINALMVVDDEQRVQGALNMHDLLRAGVV